MRETPDLKEGELLEVQQSTEEVSDGESELLLLSTSLFTCKVCVDCSMAFKMFSPHNVDCCNVFQRTFQMNQHCLPIWDGWMRCMSGYSLNSEEMFAGPVAISKEKT